MRIPSLLLLFLLSLQLHSQIKHVELSLLHGFSVNRSSKYWGKINDGKQIGLCLQSRVFRSWSIQLRSRYKTLDFYRVDWYTRKDPIGHPVLETVGVINTFELLDFSVLLGYPIIEKEAYSINLNIGRGFSRLLNDPELEPAYWDRFQGLVDRFNFFEMGVDLKLKVNDHIFYVINLQYNYMSFYKAYYYSNVSYQLNSMITYRFD